VEGGEPVLLVGETGVGKTAGVQFLADQTGRLVFSKIEDRSVLGPNIITPYHTGSNPESRI